MTRTGLLIGALCAILVAAISIADRGFSLEWQLHDAFTRAVAAHDPPDPRIVIVALNEKSVENLQLVGYGRPPFPRDIYAHVINVLRDAGARVIAIDVQLSGEDLAHPEADRALTAALGGAPVVLVAQTQRGAPAPNAFASKLWRIRDARDATRYGVIEPSAQFRDAAGIGTVRLTENSTEAPVHSYRLADAVEGGWVPGLALEAVRQFRGGPREISFREFPLDANGDPLIRWHGAAGNDLRYTTFDFDKVLAPALAPEAYSPETLAKFRAQFKDKIVFIGYTATGLFDLRATPLSPHMAGVEIHANATDDLLNGRFNRHASAPLTFLVMIVVAAIAGSVIRKVRTQWLAALIAIGGIGLWLGAGYFALVHGVVLRTVAGAASIALTYVVITVVEFAAEQRQTQVLRTTFGRYVSPQILEHILAHPEKVELGGERRDLTILFSDIRGFTSISEASEPEQVVEMLNEYLTRMVEILLDHGGTLDKFIGDAVMGFWNAPAPDPDHPVHAVDCAIEMIRVTAELRERWETEGKPAIRIGIGINTGEAVVGNIGAEKVFGYTVIGDAVNLASRLEGKNKDYKTEIIVSEFTLARIGDRFETVYLDDVKVKGKENAVRIYEVRGKRNDA